jgi:hypothetical protein
LRLKVISGVNLAKKDIFGASDPYIKIDLVKSSFDLQWESEPLTPRKKDFFKYKVFY